MKEFQSTPPVKAATRADKVRLDDIFISIHAAREGGDAAVFVNVHASDDISIHAAREGGDAFGAALRRAENISIHAAREGGDGYRAIIHIASSNFNPRRP